MAGATSQAYVYVDPEEAEAFGRGLLLHHGLPEGDAATVAQWFGVAATDLPTIFPNLANFSAPTLTFMG